MLALAAGRLGEAEDLVSQAFALGQRALPTAATPVYHLQRYTFCDFRGSLEEVEADICELAAEYPARLVFRCALALLHARIGRTREAKRALDDLAQDDFSALPFDQEWLYGISLLTETSALLGDTHSAPVLYRLLVPWATLNVADVGEGIRGSVARYLGLLAAARSSWMVAAEHFEQALKQNSRMGARPWVTHTRYDYACMLLERDEAGDRERAEELLASAQAACESLGMTALADKITALDRELESHLAG
jgi:hypothetical protein